MTRRDSRIDFLRGVALMVIFVDHVEVVTGHFVLRGLTLHQFCLSDALEAFVFLSGYVFGLVHRQQQRGFWISQVKAIRRAIVLAATNGACLVAVLAIAWAVGMPSQTIAMLRLGEAINQPLTSALTTVMPNRQPFGFDVLPLYFVLLCIAPPVVWLAKRNPFLAITCSIVLYLFAQYFPHFPLLENSAHGWEYQPLAWQAVFFAGCLASSQAIHWSSGKFSWVIAAVAVVGLVASTVSAPEIIRYIGDWQASWLLNRQTAGPLRLLHFALLAIVLSALLRRFPQIISLSFLHWLTLCGRQSLMVFLVGLWLTHAAAIFLVGSHWTELLMFELSGAILSTLASGACESISSASTKNNRTSG